MYHFNEKLFKNLSSILGVTKIALSERLYGNPYQYQRRISNPLSMRFQELTDVCNILRIPMKHFIGTAEHDVVFGESSKYVVPKSVFVPIVFRAERIKRVYGKDGLVQGLVRKTFAENMEAAYANVERWINGEESTMTVGLMLKMCNMYSLDISHFVTDMNAELPPVGEPSMPETTRRMWQEVTELRESVSAYRKRVDDLLKTVADLKLAAHDGRMLAERETRHESDAPKVRKWTFDFHLLNSLYKVVEVPKAEMQRSTGMRLYKPEGFGDTLTVNGLVSLCNAWQISTRHFFRRGDCGDEAIREYGYYRTDEWEPVKFHPEYVSDLYGKESMTGLKLEDIIDAGITTIGEIRGWRKPESSMTVGDMLEVCNRLDVTPWCFITDRNRTALAYRVTMTEFLLEENRLLRRKIMRLKKRKGGDADE